MTHYSKHNSLWMSATTRTAIALTYQQPLLTRHQPALEVCEQKSVPHIHLVTGVQGADTSNVSTKTTGNINIQGSIKFHTVTISTNLKLVMWTVKFIHAVSEL